MSVFSGDTISGILEDVCRRGTLAAHVAGRHGYPGGSGHATLVYAPRLTLCLSGQSRYRILGDEGPEDVKLGPDNGIYLPAGTWIVNTSDQRYTSLGIVFHSVFTRFLGIHYDPRQCEAVDIQPDSWYHASGVLGDAGRSFCQALEQTADADPSDLYVRRLFDLVLLTARELLSPKPIEENGDVPLGGKAFATWQAAFQYVTEHCSQNIGRDDVGRFLGIHPNHVSRLFARFSGESFTRFLLKARLERARELLQEPQLNVDQISQLCGFSSTNYFIRCFRNEYGTTPGRARVELDAQ